MKLFEEFKRRNVFRAGVAYLALAWVLLQIADVIAPILVLPDWIARAVLFMLALGLPVVLVLAWAYELTPDGIKLEKDVDRSGSGPSAASPWINRLIIGSLSVAVVLLIADRFVGSTPGRESTVEGEGAAQLASANVADAGHVSPTIVVLPLDNLMNDPEQAYFVEGMHEALITELSKVDALSVISRTSAVRYRNSTLSLPEIARELGVDMVIEGSVLRAGNTVRITAQLIDGSDDRHLWADTFDRELVDILSLYSDVTRQIVAQIEIEITPQDEERLTRTPMVNAASYERYLRGWHECETWNPVNMLRGIDLMREATELDSESAMAHAGLAACLQYTAYFGFLEPLSIVEEARSAALRAVELDEGLAEARVALAGVHYYLDLDMRLAEGELRRALEVNPGSYRAFIHYSWLLGEAGRFEEALQFAERAIGLDPYAAVAHNALGQVHYLARDYDLSILAYGAALELDRGDASAYYALAWPHEQKGDFETAIELHLRAVDLSGGAPLFRSGLAYAYAKAGREDEAREIMEDLEAPFDLATAHLGLGEWDSALELLEQAYDTRTGHLAYINQGPKFDPLRGNERFNALISKVGW